MSPFVLQVSKCAFWIFPHCLEENDDVALELRITSGFVQILGPCMLHGFQKNNLRKKQ